MFIVFIYMFLNHTFSIKGPIWSRMQAYKNGVLFGKNSDYTAGIAARAGSAAAFAAGLPHVQGAQPHVRPMLQKFVCSVLRA